MEFRPVGIDGRELDHHVVGEAPKGRDGDAVTEALAVVACGFGHAGQAFVGLPCFPRRPHLADVGVHDGGVGAVHAHVAFGRQRSAVAGRVGAGGHAGVVGGGRTDEDPPLHEQPR